MAISTTGTKKANVVSYNGTALTGNLNAVIANIAGLVTQIGNAFIATGSSTGSSTLSTTINTSKPYWIIMLGVSTSAAAAARTARLTSFNGSVLGFARTDAGGGVEDLTVQYMVVGTP